MGKITAHRKPEVEDRQPSTEGESPSLREKILDVLGQATVGMTTRQMATALNKTRQWAREQDIGAQIRELVEQVTSLPIAERPKAFVPKVILPELHDARTGRIDARKVAGFIGIPLKQLSEGLGLNYKAVHRSPSSVSFQKALMPLKRSLEYLQQAFQKPEIIRVWLNTPHPLLDDRTSLEIILEGKAFAVERLLGNAWEGVVS